MRRPFFAACRRRGFCAPAGHIAASAACERFRLRRKPRRRRALPAEQVKFLGGPAKAAAFVGDIPLDRAASFLVGQKGGKKPLRTYGSKDSLLPAGLRRSDSGAWGSRGLPFPSRALRPAAVELSTFLSQRTAPAAVGVGGFVFLRLLR